jgi:P-type Ca2+ transporter type 2C
MVTSPMPHTDTKGLTEGEAQIRLAADGPNELPRAGSRSAFKIVGEVLREPMLALLLAGGVAYLVLGSLTEALILLTFALFSIVLTVVQEARTEHVLEALRDLSAPRAMVVRDGARLRIAGREVVRGDLLVLEQGDRVAADALLLEAHDFQADESLLTGEALPVHKKVGAGEAAHRPGGDGQPYVYSGSLVTRGSGLASAVATGALSEIGKIGQSLATLDPEPPRLRLETARIVKLSAIGGGAIALLVVLLYGLLRGDWMQAVLAGIATGMSMLPEEFPVVLTIFMAMGAWRIGKVRVLTRRSAAIETLGSATVLCTDKTGTLTENRMAVSQIWLASGKTAEVKAGVEIPDAFHFILETSILASATMPVDPMEIALHATAPRMPADYRHVHSYGLRPDLLAMSNIWKGVNPKGNYVIAAKGAPEAMAALCRLAPAAARRMTAAVDTMAAQGIRVLGVAVAHTTDKRWAKSQRDYAFKLIGLVGLADPIRESVPEAVAQCRSAGIRVVMITGDYAATARAIALQAGLADGDVLTGPELEDMDDFTLARHLDRVSVFARIMPEQKLRIVNAYKAAGEVVAMTGDGVNDAPSLKSAHIGIAMGKRGTDVAREASAIVLLDDDFGSIVQAIRLGRGIYDNIRKAMAFIFAVHVPLAGFALLPLVFGLPILFGPIHIAFIEMIIDPVCAVVFESEREEADIMDRKPRDPEQRLFSLPMVTWSIFQGLVVFGTLATLFLGATFSGMPEGDVRELTFLALVISIVALILVNRSFGTSLKEALTRKNVTLRYILGAITAVLSLTLFIPAFRTLLKFGTPGWRYSVAALVLGGFLLVLLELLKPYANRQMRDQSPPPPSAKALRPKRPV